MLVSMRNDLRKLREERKWSGVYVADLVGVSKQNIYAIENGTYDPSLELAIKLARLFAKPVEEIFHVDAPESQPVPGEPAATT